ncbi:sensor histidine kinase [Alkalicoccus luteus]|uniref:sensor histidine kinase n=1 Tax=Alkalicoccus luteus TaxID=1237094 RepID=UPI004034179A
MAEVEQKRKPSGLLWSALQVQLKAAAAGTLLFTSMMLLIGIEIDLLPIVLAAGMAFILPTAFFHYQQVRTEKRRMLQYLAAVKQRRRGAKNTFPETEGDELGRLMQEVTDMIEDDEQQVASLKRVLDENASLLEERERGAGQEERRRLARELHDSVSQQLFAVSMSMSAMPKLIEQAPKKAAYVARQVTAMVQESQQELRALIMQLRPVTLDGKPLKEAVDQLFQELDAKHERITFQADTSGIPECSKGVEEHIFRVLQEGISNALRHGKPEHVKLSAAAGSAKTMIVLTDDGSGFDPEAVKSTSYGLMTMKERMVELGGHMTIISRPGKGTRLEFRLPVERSAVM